MFSDRKQSWAFGSHPTLRPTSGHSNTRSNKQGSRLPVSGRDSVGNLDRRELPARAAHVGLGHGRVDSRGQRHTVPDLRAEVVLGAEGNEFQVPGGSKHPIPRRCSNRHHAVPVKHLTTLPNQ